MAEVTGFDVEFAKKPDSLLPTDCAICHLVLRKPCETTCCGVYFCKPCIEKQQRYKQTCPHCRDKLGWQVSQAQERHINQLKVFCEHKARGCEWVGELGQLKKHLNEKSLGNTDRHCKFVLVACDWCHEEVKRGDFDQHKSKECPSREVECPHHSKGCDWRGPQHTLDEHLNSNLAAGRLEGCGFIELSCTYNCGESIERRNYEQHDAACQLDQIECEFKSLGCEERVARKDMPAHLENNVQHLRLASINLQKIKKECEEIKFERDVLHCLLKKKLRESKSENKSEMESFQWVLLFIGGPVLLLLIGMSLMVCMGDSGFVSRDQLQKSLHQLQLENSKLNQSLLHQLQLDHSELNQSLLYQLQLDHSKLNQSLLHQLQLENSKLNPVTAHQLQLENSKLNQSLLRMIQPDLSQVLPLPADLTLEGYSIYTKLGLPWISPPLKWPKKNDFFFLEIFLKDSTFSTSMYLQLRTSSRHHSQETVFKLRPLPNTIARSCTLNFRFREWASPNEVVTGYQLYPVSCEPFQYVQDGNRVLFSAIQLLLN